MTSPCVYLQPPLNPPPKCPYLGPVYANPALPPPNGPNRSNKPKYTIIKNSYIHRFFKYHNRPVWYPN